MSHSQSGSPHGVRSEQTSTLSRLCLEDREADLCHSGNEDGEDVQFSLPDDGGAVLTFSLIGREAEQEINGAW